MENRKQTITRAPLIILFFSVLATIAGVAQAADQAQPQNSAKSTTLTDTRCVAATDEAIAELFAKWNLALASLDATKVAALYWPDAVLLPTVSNTPRTDTASITDYFSHFLLKFPRGKILTRTVYHGCGFSLDMGTYEFSVMDPAGNSSSVRARYSFAYTYRSGVWKIQHHHSSAMPEPINGPDTDTAKHDYQAAPNDSGHAKSAGSATTPGDESSIAKSETSRSEPLRPPSRRPVRIQLDSAPRTPDALLSAEQRRKVGRETVGLKVCTVGKQGPRNVEISDPAPHKEANDAAIAWAREARWLVVGEPEASIPICAQIVVRFTDSGL